MPSYQLQFTIWPTSNLQADASTNVWSITADDVSALDDAAQDIADFYKSIVTIFPDTVRQSGHTIKGYDRSDPVPRAPVYEDTFDFTGAPTSAPNAAEVALCMSFQAIPISGVPQARRRGRVYLGPLRTSIVDTTGRPTATAINTIATAGEAVLAASVAATTWEWVVHSTVAATDAVIVEGWVDNEFDTQRRRGRIATARTVFP